MAIYRIEGRSAVAAERTTFAQQGLHERRDIQSLLKTQIEIIAPNTLVVAEEFGDWEDSRRRIDLLAIDKDANLVVIELKCVLQTKPATDSRRSLPPIPRKICH